MKKMNFASVSCEIAVADNFYFSTESICEYGRDTVRYAVERFFAKNIGLQRKCTWEGEWVRVAGMIDSRGVCIKRVQILREHPCFASEAI